ncbi:very short patch repair endonuclease [Streptomyces sp. NBC_00513]|uniref:very short patch repair endonuclease n=1 Tax=unclassified Streptomyces TaxID=2593676 RepID=UPI00225C14CF|nr:very short patch repair endonuclease [Streptomyces sp. NBC_00424]MCX5072672.1 very short patch repair endonuclease [Streptomyces sp. NBC_00424]WUD44011.1 very short patch repair endonuclease [Streptomyces sp. NBC_00513]
MGTSLNAVATVEQIQPGQTVPDRGAVTESAATSCPGVETKDSRRGVPSPRDANARRVMVAQRNRDTAPELALRRALHSLGFRYRVNMPIPGMPRRRADVTFTRWRTAVFVQGCFWHACQQHLHAPKHNSEWWRQKLEGNVRRDEETDAHLVHLGWLPLRIWEHEGVDDAVGRVTAALATRDHPRALRLGGQGMAK